jgi:signal transduction histidine kinase
MIVWADELALRRLVMILADNALKFTPSGGRVAVRLQALESECAIEVSDTGCGIRDEELPHVFERFYRADPARTPGDGTGLGLAIAWTIVEAHHGRIEAMASEGIGSVFRVVLPLALSPSALVEHS